MNDEGNMDDKNIKECFFDCVNLLCTRAVMFLMHFVNDCKLYFNDSISTHYSFIHIEYQRVPLPYYHHQIQHRLFHHRWYFLSQCRSMAAPTTRQAIFDVVLLLDATPKPTIKHNLAYELDQFTAIWSIIFSTSSNHRTITFCASLITAYYRRNITNHQISFAL